MDILYTTDSNYLDIMLTSLYSLIKNSNLDHINLHVVTSNFERQDYYRLRGFMDYFDNVKLFTYDLDDLNIEKYNIPNWRGSQIANARLFYPRIVKEKNPDCSNLLYLDSDTIVVGDIYNITKHNNDTVSACKDELSTKKYYQNKLSLDSYYNSGVIYFNLDKYLDLNIEDKIKHFNKSNDISLTFPDQDLLNILLRDNINTLEPRYNMSTNSYFLNGLYLKLFYNSKIRQISYKDILNERNNNVVLHSYGILNLKPWTDNQINPFNEVFMSYMRHVNDKFTKEELKALKKLISMSPFIFKNLSIIKSYMPNSADYLYNNVVLKLEKNKKEY